MEEPRSRYSVKVTEDDIKKAHIGDSYKCVIAQAIARQIPNAHHIEVDIQTIRWSDENGRHVFLTPLSAAGYVIAFDAAEDVHPFRFQLRDAVPSMQKRPVSAAAKAVKESRGKVRNEKRRLARAEQALTQDLPTDEAARVSARIAEAPERIAAAETAYEDLKAAYKEAGETIWEERVSETARPAPRKAHKTKQRAYGARILRVNQAEDRVHYAGRAGSTAPGYDEQ